MRSRIKRSKESLRPIQITERDKEVLKSVYEYRTLSTEQINHLLFSSISRARKRLYQLWQHGYLNRIIKPTRLGEGSSSFFYALSGKGAGLLKSAGLGEFAANRRLKMSFQYGEHAARINDFRICLELASRKSADLKLLSWQQGKEQRLMIPARGEGTGKPETLIPDAFFGLNVAGKDYFYFLEIDQGTADLGRIRSKYRAYLSLWNDKTAISKLGIRSFRVLYITAGERRYHNMLTALKALERLHPRLDIIALTDQRKYSLTAPAMLFEPIWKTVLRAGAIQTLCPFPVSSIQNSRPHQVNHQCADQKPELAKGEHGPGG